MGIRLPLNMTQAANPTSGSHHYDKSDPPKCFFSVCPVFHPPASPSSTSPSFLSLLSV